MRKTRNFFCFLEETKDQKLKHISLSTTQIFDHLKIYPFVFDYDTLKKNIYVLIMLITHAIVLTLTTESIEITRLTVTTSTI